MREEPSIRLVRGEPSPEELAAVVVAVLALADRAVPPPPRRAATWWRTPRFAAGGPAGAGPAWRTEVG
ncbi:acyl-CoA carboxylase epsilon subunit [Saccharothrix sp. Mg75]|uniref:acyl-CoA carboxylase epsilon subunit n=1 Tax=Saccharothrix sp. Mg75 TaxID=3445357 RepID=UPI003EF002B9